MSLPLPGFSDPTLHSAEFEAQLSLADPLQQQILQYTQEMFGGPVEIRAESDPETDQRYFAVEVAAGGDVVEVAELYDAWHRQLLGMAGAAAGFYRLALSVR